MRVVIQRVSHAEVVVHEENYSNSIGKGLLVLAAFEESDTDTELEWMARKIASLRIFDDENGVMNLSVTDMDGEVMIISQFTLYASIVKGNRPSYIRAAGPSIAKPLYERFCAIAEEKLGAKVVRGIFGADMKVSLLNDGPVTIVADTKDKF